MLTKHTYEAVLANAAGGMWKVVDEDGIFVDGPFLDHRIAAQRALRLNEAAVRVKQVGANEYVAEISLVVKGSSVEQVESKIVGRLNEWFIEPPLQCPPGGFPDGTLLYYSFLEGGRAV